MTEQEEKIKLETLRKRSYIFISVGIAIFLISLAFLIWGITGLDDLDTLDFPTPILIVFFASIPILSGLAIAFYGFYTLKSKGHKITTGIAKRLSPELRIGSEAIADGHETLLRKKETIRVKCKYCGYLNSEDATVCSNCGASF